MKFNKYINKIVNLKNKQIKNNSFIFKKHTQFFFSYTIVENCIFSFTANSIVNKIKPVHIFSDDILFQNNYLKFDEKACDTLFHDFYY